MDYPYEAKTLTCRNQSNKNVASTAANIGGFREGASIEDVKIKL